MTSGTRQRTGQHATALVWFRRDLRLADNQALSLALQRAHAVVPVTLLQPQTQEAQSAASTWRLRSLEALDAALRTRGSRLIVRGGPAETVLPALATATGATLVTCTRDWDPRARAEEAVVESACRKAGLEFVACEGSLLVPPEALRTKEGRTYRVFTPFFAAWESAVTVGALHEALSSAPDPIPGPEAWPPSEDGHLESVAGERPLLGWAPGESGALDRLRTFVDDGLAHYDSRRDLPAIEGTSRLSPHLALGEIAAVRIVAEAQAAAGAESARPFLRQLAWREFAYHVLTDFPDLAKTPWRSEFASFPWREDDADLDDWRAGRTGYPIVDAGMRELAETGWMHNRVRLVTASFLVKDLLLPWQAGEAHFEERLFDLDPAANAFNWQWVAGSGADAAPYFRIFNPVVQGERFDPDGEYVRRWVPELLGLGARWIHRPWEAPVEELAEAGVALGKTYPRRIVDHPEARERALAALAATRAR